MTETLENMKRAKKRMAKKSTVRRYVNKENWLNAKRDNESLKEELEQLRQEIDQVKHNARRSMFS